jgi:hypothetical protein
MKSPVFAGILLSTVAAAGCGSDNNTTVDGRPIRPDAVVVDAPGPDAPGPTFGATISLLEASVLNPRMTTAFGQGPSFSAVFNDVTALGAPVYEEIPGSTLGCKAWNLTAARTIASLIGIDEGPLAITTTGTAPAFPPGCGYGATTGYVCPDMTTASTGGTIGTVNANLASLTDPDNTFTAGNTGGRYVKISGAAMPGNNGAFPIVMMPGPNTIVYLNPAHADETLPGAAVHLNLAAVGPIPSMPDPGFLANEAGITIAHAASTHIPAFSATTSSGGVGDDFVLEDAELNKLNAVPLDGSAFTITCTAANCPAGSAIANVLQITTTDSTALPSPFSFPPPTTSSVRIQCGGLSGANAGGSITVPAEAMALLKNATGITRIRASFSRVDLMGGNQPATVSLLAGHTVLGFTNTATLR